MSGTKLKRFAQAGIHHTEGRLTLAEKTMKKATQAKDIQLPTVSSSTGAAVTAVIRGR